MQRSNPEARVAPHPAIQANSMGVDVLGKYCILGTRRHLIVVDLDQPKEVKRRINRQSNWDVTQVQWNPCIAKKEYFATTYSQTADVWTYNEGTCAQLATLKGHTRTISDMDWCPCDENLIATCSVDTFINVWDIRDTKRPKMTPSAVAGACQVKWNKSSCYILATAHDGDIRIWDIRNGRTPMQYITAHLSKIHSLDWSNQDSSVLASSGQDTTVRFWDTSQPSAEADFQISAGAPVWKARYTPFGYGMVTTLMPQMHRWDNSALLWNVKTTSKMVHSYAGHRDVILDFGWRYIVGERTAELVTWSKDHSLFLWRCDSSLLTACGCGTSIDDDDLNEDVLYDDYASGDQAPGTLMPNETPQATIGLESGAHRSDYGKGIPTHASTPRVSYPRELLGTSPRILSSSPSFVISAQSPVAKTSSPPNSLERELNMMNIELPNLNIDEVDPQHRTCVAVAWSNYIVVKIRMSFPLQYPNNVTPIFQIMKPTNVRQAAGIKLVNLLRERALSQVRSNLPCLEVCLRFLSSYVDNMLHSEMTPQDSYAPYASSSSQPHGYSMYGTYQHLVKIPFPRTSGARFCGAGHLVTFMRPTQVKGFEASAEQTTPRCLVALLDLRQESLIQKQVKAGMPPSLAQTKISFPYGSSPTADNPDISVKSFYYREKKSRKPKHNVKDSEANSAISSEKLQMRLHKAAGKVVIQDLSSSLPMNRTLAEEYIVPTKSNYIEACRKNRDVAEKIGRKDLVELWSTLELVQSSVFNDKSSSGKPWAEMAFGKQLVAELIAHYSKLLDVQTLAMMSCMFAPDYGSKPNRNYQLWHNAASPGSIARSFSYNSFENDSGSGSHRSNSFCEHPSDMGWPKTGHSPQNYYFNIESPSDDYRYLGSPVLDFDCRDEDILEKSIELLDRNNQQQYDAFKQAYANVLDRWKLVNQKTQILKYIHRPATPHSGLTFQIVCENCHSDTQYPQCTACMKFAMRCALCRLPIKKLMNFCFLCGHGGHLHHMDSWFESNTVCATGCGCECRPRLKSF